MNDNFQKPRPLRSGDKLCAISLSWGGAGAYPKVFSEGCRAFEKLFDVQVVPSRHALAAPDWLSRNPKARADDLLEALADPTITGIISSIGGDDSIRVARHVPPGAIADNPKVFLGYSDSTITHFLFLRDKVVSFYGPSIMAGLFEVGGTFDYTAKALKASLADNSVIKFSPSFAPWANGNHDWTNMEAPRSTQKPAPWKILHGRTPAEGILVGGCVEVLQFMFGTDLWPIGDFWNGKILFFETSEDGISPCQLKWFLRTLAAQGVLRRLSGLLFGRPGGDKLRISDFDLYDEAILQVVAQEEGLDALLIVTRMDFGHTDPVFVIPQGICCRVNLDPLSLELLEPATMPN